MPAKRSAEEGTMREACAAELRKRYPDARIIHELPLRYSTNRIDLAAVTPTKLVALEIKSSRDVADRLEKQLVSFLQVSHRVIVALAPKWNPETGSTPAQTAMTRARAFGSVVVWTCGEAGLDTGYESHWIKDALPWSAKMLDMLWVAELKMIADKHRISYEKRGTHTDLVRSCFHLMTGAEIGAAVCAMLRSRDAFDRLSDAPIR